MDLTRRSKQVLKLAEEIARRFGHNYVGTEHLLLALIEEQDGIAGQIIRDTGVDQTLHRRLEEILRSEAYRSASSGMVDHDENEVDPKEFGW